MDKEIVLFINTQTHTLEYYSDIKKQRTRILGDNMNGLQGYYAKWNKSEKDKCQIIPLYVKLKQQEEIKVMDTEKRQVVVRGGKGGRNGWRG